MFSCYFPHLPMAKNMRIKQVSFIELKSLLLIISNVSLLQFHNHLYSELYLVYIKSSQWL